MPCYKISDITW